MPHVGPSLLIMIVAIPCADEALTLGVFIPMFKNIKKNIVKNIIILGFVQ